MGFLRQQWLGIALLTAIVVSFVVGQIQTRTNTAQVRQEAIEVCYATSGSAALVVAYKISTAQAARERGEEALALEYEKLARGGLDLIPLPKDKQRFRPVLINLRTEGDHYVLTDKATALMREGCRESYDAH